MPKAKAVPVFCLLALLPMALAACTARPLPIASAPAARPATESKAALDTEPSDIAVLNRVSWGAQTSDAQRLGALGLDRYLEEQLNPPQDDVLPPEIEARIAAMEISRKSPVEIVREVRGLRQAARAAGPGAGPAPAGTPSGKPQASDARQAYRQKLVQLGQEAATRSLLRDLYSRNQLKEQLTWFWMNHFNVSQKKDDLRALVGDYEESAIRPHVLGKFRDLLIATATHPAMLEYLDNARNAVGHINENYAREIMELHTMGVGSGYTQQDVEALAHILTGLGVGNGTSRPARGGARGVVGRGLFVFAPRRHNSADQQFLGARIKGGGMDEIVGVLTLLAAQPATARHVSTELAQYFCCDQPPDTLVDKMTATWLARDGDIKAVLQTLFAAPEFRASLGGKFKDPIHYTISALRVAYGSQVIADTKPVLNWLGRMGEPLYGHETPDGYAMTEAAWSGPGEMETRFEIARQIGAGQPPLDEPVSAGGPAMPRPAPPLLVQTAYYRAVAPTLSQATLGALGQAKTPAERNMLFLASPEFMHR